jgi:hypothetical protein
MEVVVVAVAVAVLPHLGNSMLLAPLLPHLIDATPPLHPHLQCLLHHEMMP